MKWFGAWLLSMPVWFGIILWAYLTSLRTQQDAQGFYFLFWVMWFGFGIIMLGVKLLFF